MKNILLALAIMAIILPTGFANGDQVPDILILSEPGSYETGEFIPASVGNLITIPDKKPEKKKSERVITIRTGGSRINKNKFDNRSVQEQLQDERRKLRRKLRGSNRGSRPIKLSK